MEPTKPRSRESVAISQEGAIVSGFQTEGTFYVEPIYLVAEFVEDCLGLCAARHHHTTTASVCTVAATKRARCSPKSTAVSLRVSTHAI